MTDLLEEAWSRARQLPRTMQDDLARLILSFAGADEPAIVLDPDEEQDIDQSDAAARRREFAAETEVTAVWAKYGL
jgi:hypothetical protein